MQKAYLLLRNNQQTGPYTREEILQVQLRPFDLVWVEGESAAWQYPGEIQSLQDEIPSVLQVNTNGFPDTLRNDQIGSSASDHPQSGNNTRVFVSLPGNPKTYGYQQKVFMEQPVWTEPVVSSEGSHSGYNTYSRETAPVPGESKVDTSESGLQEQTIPTWKYVQAPKKKSLLNPKALLIALFLLGLSAAAFYLIPGNKNKAVTGTLQHPAVPDPLVESPVIPAPAIDDKANTETELSPSTSPAKKSAPKIKTVIVKKQSDDPSPQNAEQAIATPKEALPLPKDEVTEADVVLPKASETPKKEKKKLGEVVRNIFGKKEKKNEDAPLPKTDEEPRPATNRQAQKRGESSEPGIMPDHSELVQNLEISSNAPDNWMMGIQDLKVTLRNRNGIAIRKAMVDVVYLDRDNKQVDKKTLVFSNVPAKNKLVQSAPDHKWADHVEFRLGQVEIKDDRYAKD